MIRGTTPTLEFTLPFDCSLISCVYITFSQKKEALIEKTFDDCEKSESKLIVKLSQEDTLKLSESVSTEIQIRAKTHAGEALASQIFHVATERILKDGVI